MKAIPISILVLVAFPIHLLAQQSNDFNPKSSNSKPSNYYAKRYFEVETPAKHIVDSSRQSNRKGASSFNLPVTNSSQPASRFKFDSAPAPVAKNDAARKSPGSGTMFRGGNFSNLEVQPLQNSSSAPIARVAMRPEISFRPIKPGPPTVASQPIQEPAIEITPPEPPQGLGVAPQDIVRPTPDNSASGLYDAQPSFSDPDIVEAPVEPLMPEEPQRDVYSQDAGQTYSVEPEAIPFNEFPMSQPQRSFENDTVQGSSMGMRHVTDHFSPGGEPFARRGVVGRANYFGIDRHSCCDEWAFCNCGGLKGSPGHLGSPWLKSKDPCDTVNPITGRCQAKRAGKCGCAQCAASSSCGCGQ